MLEFRSNIVDFGSFYVNFVDLLCVLLTALSYGIGLITFSYQIATQSIIISCYLLFQTMGLHPFSFTSFHDY